MGMKTYEEYIEFSQSVGGWLTLAEAQALLMGAKLAYAQELGPMFCEIGALEGKSAIVIASVLKIEGKGGIFWSVDPHEGGLSYPHRVSGGKLDGEIVYSREPTLPAFIENVERAGLTAFVNPVVGKSTDFYPPFNLNFLFIDALHDEQSVRQDWNHFQPRLKSGAIVCWHDYDVWSGVTNTVNDLLERGIIEKVYQGDSLIVTRYKGAK